MSRNLVRTIGRQWHTRILPVAAAAGTAIAALPAMAQQSEPIYYGPHMWGGWGWFFGPFMMLAVVVLIVVLTALVVRWLGGFGPGGIDRVQPGKAALDILRERFARGEIDKQEFEDRQRTLGV
jgi:putative membrane protein